MYEKGIILSCLDVLQTNRTKDWRGVCESIFLDKINSDKNFYTQKIRTKFVCF